MGFLDKATGWLTGGALLIAGIAMGNPAVAILGGATLLGAALSDTTMGSLGRRGLADSPTYGFDSAQNVAFDGSPRFYVLGEERIAPAYVSFFTQQYGAKQYLFALLYAGEGGPYGIESLSEFKINDQDSDSFSGIKITHTYGTQDQTALSGFDKEATPVAVNVALTGMVGVSDDTQVTSHVHATTREVDEVTFVLTWYGGIAKGSNNNEASEVFQIRYRETGTTDWTWALPDENGPFWVKNTVKKHNGWTVSGKTTSVFRAAITVQMPERGSYQFSFARTSHGDNPIGRYPTIVRIEEVQGQTGAHPGKVLVGIRFLAQEQLDGGLPSVTCLCRGWKVKNQGDSAAAWTRNPSKLVEAVLTDADDGCGDWVKSADLSNGSGESWRTVAARCDANAASSGAHKEPRWQLDYVVDSQASAIEHLGAMLATFRAALVEWEGKIHLVQDYAGSSVATFDGRQARDPTNRPILAAEDGRLVLEESEIPTDDPGRPTHVKVQYRDRANDYERRWTDEYVSPEWSAGQPIIRRDVFLVGVTRETQAIREARYMINRGRLRALQVQFGVGLGDLDLLPGDVVTLYTDYPAWAGKLFQVQATTVAQDGRGRIRALVYDANAYTDTSDTLPARPAWVSRQEALKKARQIPRGATNVKLKEVAS